MPRKKINFWLTEKGLSLIAGWAGDGLSEKEIASAMEISLNTLCLWKKNYEPIKEALLTPKGSPDLEVENALRNSAINGNTTAQIFWLKNRRPDKWQDKPADPKAFAQLEDDPLTLSIKESLSNGLL